MSDSRDTTTGAVESGEQVAIGRGNRQSSRHTDARSDPQQNVRQGDITFSNQDNLQLWMKLMEMADDIRTFKREMIADIRVLDTKIDGLPDRVGKLERVEVTVRPVPEVVIRPVSDSVNLSARMLITILGVAFLAVLVLVGYLLYLQVLRV